jgi:hypothetical protein
VSYELLHMFIYFLIYEYDDISYFDHTEGYVIVCGLLRLEMYLEEWSVCFITSISR